VKCRVLFPPIIPYLHAVFEYSEMFRIGHGMAPCQNSFNQEMNALAKPRWQSGGRFFFAFVVKKAFSGTY
jgi:hypothetical protein